MNKKGYLLPMVLIMMVIAIIIFMPKRTESQETSKKINLPTQCYSTLQPSRYFSSVSWKVLVSINENSGKNLNIVAVDNRSLEITQIEDTGSMRPALNDHSIVILIIPTKEEVKIGDIILIKAGQYQNNSNIALLHRVVKIVNNSYQTKGDNNDVPETQLWKFEDIDKKVVGVLY